MSEPTPRPWKWDKWIEPTENGSLAYVYTEDDYGRFPFGEFDTPEDASLSSKAVNLHEDLVAMLREVQPWFVGAGGTAQDLKDRIAALLKRAEQ